MAHVVVDDCSFSYPPAGSAPAPVPAFSNVSFAVEEGAFCVVVGATGCGKTTLLRSLKPELAPAGTYRGSIAVDGTYIVKDGRMAQEIDARTSAASIGYVMQDPDAQIVCDSVWHELAFSLENIGCAPDTMRRRIAEVAHFFGIEPWVRAHTETLSGGQKQIVSLAAALAARPRLLLLDEPTAQLDPNARKQFLFMLSRVNRELGITVIMATHAPEEAQAYATQWVVMGKMGQAAPRELAEGRLRERWEKSRAALAHAKPHVTLRDVRFRYEREAPWVLRGASLDVMGGRVHAIVGGNGCGKTTLLKVMAGVVRPQRGAVKNALSASQALLPQDPKALFVRDSVSEELAEWRERCGYAPKDEEAMLERFGLAACALQHPYDLSGGQQQKLALAKLLLCDPRLLFLDEPTKGLDPQACAEAARILREMAREGRTVVFVTHDLDFALVAADDVSMVFDGEVACTEFVQDFFAGNLVYRPNDLARLYGEV